MFLTVKQAHAYGNTDDGRYFRGFDEAGHRKPSFSMKEARDLMRRVRKATVSRNLEISSQRTGGAGLFKWYRPWEVVPEIRDWAPPAGDFGVGVEVEYGFRELEDAQYIAGKVEYWKNVCVDDEGQAGRAGVYGLEVTFPPMVYSKISSRSPVFRYTKMLSENLQRIAPHTEGWFVGTHVNVSSSTPHNNTLYNQVREHIAIRTTPAQNLKYFGRAQLYQNTAMNYTKFIEWKMFNSTTDVKQLKRYINVAVELTKLCVGDGTETITLAQVLEACEAGYNKR